MSSPSPNVQNNLATPSSPLVTLKDWSAEAAANFALHLIVGAIAGAALSCSVTGAVCAGSYSLIKASFSGAAEVVYTLRKDQAQAKENAISQNTTNKVISVIVSILITPFVPLLICVHLVTAVALTSLRLIQNQATAWLSMGLVYAGAVAGSYINLPVAAVLALAACCTDLFHDTFIGENRINRTFVQSFNDISQTIYPWPLSRLLTF